MSIKKHKILCFYPVFFSKRGVSHACFSVASNMNTTEMEVLTMGISSEKNFHPENYINCFPPALNFLTYRLSSSKQLLNFSESQFLKKLKYKSYDAGFIWPGTSVDLFRKTKDLDKKIIIENINCHQATSQKILNDEFKRLNITPDHTITDNAIRDENEKLKYTDYVFSPSQLVTKSLLDAGVQSNQILPINYGLSVEEILPFNFDAKKEKPLVALFAGRIGVRKGIHLLLDYWVKADINGVLKIVGNVEESAKSIIAPYLNHPKIEFISYVLDLKTLYKEADFFILPSIEEGSPLVTYLALGAGLPCLVSPMAGAGVIIHNEQGFILEPHDEESWISAIRCIAKDSELRKNQSKASHDLAQYFLWKNEGERRATKLLEKLSC